MSETITKSDIDVKIDPDVATGVAQFLAPVVVELTNLGVNGKQLHWHLRGVNFLPVHEFLDTVVDHARAWADLAAERIIALGLPVDGRVQTVVEQTKAPKLADGFQSAEQTITAAIEQIDAARAAVHTAVVELDDIDLSSQDVVIEIERGLDKDRWFLSSHLVEA